MRRDFTISLFSYLISTLKEKGYRFQKVEDFVINPAKGRIVIMRHDVDRLPSNALILAEIEKEHEVQASYYFRAVDHVWDEKVMKNIVSLGHEIAYHYEDLTITKGNTNRAIEHFKKQLKKIREIYPSKTICMHGSPLSRWDNRALWDQYDYKQFGILAEPYFDIDYSEVFYITDTGRSWNNESVSIRDKVNSGFNIEIRDTCSMIELFRRDKMPDKIMFNTHPHRWFDGGFGWYKELVSQKCKNLIKSAVIKWQNKGK